MTDWLHTMRVIRGIQQIFPVVVFGQSPQMVGFLEKDWSHANGNKCHIISRTGAAEDGPHRPKKTFEESTYCK